MTGKPYVAEMQSGYSMFVSGSLAAEKMTKNGYAMILQGVLCAVVAIASIFVKKTPKVLCVLIAIASTFLLLEACLRSTADERRWIAAACDFRDLIALVPYFIAIVICMHGIVMLIRQ